MTNVIINNEELFNEEQLDKVAGGIFIPPALQKQMYPPKMQSENPNPFETNPH